MSGDILDQILRDKREQVARKRREYPLDRLRECADAQPRARGFADAIDNAIAAGRAAVIAEIKKASPSQGVIRAAFDAAQLAQNLAAHGAACLSVLTDQRWFGGGDDDLRAARDACALPVLRKDFVIDRYQVYESRALGADAVLLIVAALDDDHLRELAELTAELGMDALIETHNRAELERACAAPGRLIGVNNRNLRTFETSLDTTLSLRDAVPAARTLITESGFAARAEIERMRAHGVHAFLIGETLMRAADPGAKLTELFDAPDARNASIKNAVQTQ